MSDETIVNQPQSTEPSGSYNTFLGTEQLSLDKSSEQNPEPTEGVIEEASELEAGDEQEQVLEGDGTREEPQVDEFLAKLSPEEHAYYAKRYPTLYKAYQDPNQPDDLKAAFRDRVNQDHAWAAKQEGATTQQVEEPTLETEADATLTPEQQRTAHYQQVDNLLSTVIDTKAIDELGANLLKGFGVDITSQDPEVQALVKNAPEVGRTLARGAVDLMLTSLPAILMREDANGVPLISQFVERAFPGTLDNFERMQYAGAWDSVRNSDPNYKDLPAYGPADSDFGKLMQAAAKQIPNFDKMQFPGKPAEQAAAKYAILAKIATGQKVKPAEVTQAVETGKRLADEQQAKRDQGKAFGAGRSSRTLDTGKDESPLRKGYNIFKERDQNIFSR
jgi:hypothetical protein